MEEPIIPVIVIDKRAVKRRGVCQCVNEAASLDLAWQAGISLRMGFLNAQGQPHMGPWENLINDLYAFFAIEGTAADPGRRVLLAHTYEAYMGLRPMEASIAREQPGNTTFFWHRQRSLLHTHHVSREARPQRSFHERSFRCSSNPDEE